MSFRPPFADPKDLADFIEKAIEDGGQLMVRLGYQNGFHKLREPETEMILAALRAYVAPTSTHAETR